MGFLACWDLCLPMVYWPSPSPVWHYLMWWRDAHLWFYTDILKSALRCNRFFAIFATILWLIGCIFINPAMSCRSRCCFFLPWNLISLFTQAHFLILQVGLFLAGFCQFMMLEFDRLDYRFFSEMISTALRHDRRCEQKESLFMRVIRWEQKSENSSWRLITSLPWSFAWHWSHKPKYRLSNVRSMDLGLFFLGWESAG